jgi:hypothetical protein
MYRPQVVCARPPLSRTHTHTQTHTHTHLCILWCMLCNQRVFHDNIAEASCTRVSLQRTLSRVSTYHSFLCNAISNFMNDMLRYRTHSLVVVVPSRPQFFDTTFFRPRNCVAGITTSLANCPVACAARQQLNQALIPGRPFSEPFKHLPVSSNLCGTWSFQQLCLMSGTARRGSANSMPLHHHSWTTNTASRFAVHGISILAESSPFCSNLPLYPSQGVGGVGAQKAWWTSHKATCGDAGAGDSQLHRRAVQFTMPYQALPRTTLTARRHSGSRLPCSGCPKEKSQMWERQAWKRCTAVRKLSLTRTLPLMAY